MLYEILAAQLSNLEEEAFLKKKIAMQPIRKNDRWYIAEGPVEIITIMYINHSQACQDIGEEMMEPATP